MIVFLRGDHSVNETKLLTLVKAATLRPMQAEELEKYFQGPAGFIGPIGLVVRPRNCSASGMRRSNRRMRAPSTVVLDEGLVGRVNMICGANKLDYHLKNVTPGKDFQYTIAADVRSVNAGEGCPNCGVAAAHRHRGRDRAHLQAGLQVFATRWARACSIATARKSRRSWAVTGLESSAF